TFVDCDAIQKSPPAPTAGGGTAAALVGVLPADATTGKAPRTVRTGFLRFGDGLPVELTLHAAVTDAGAEAEFRRLLDSARPAAADPVAGVAEALALPPTGQANHPAGAVRIDLTPDYHGPEHFILATTDDTVRYQLERAAPSAAVMRGA